MFFPQINYFVNIFHFPIHFPKLTSAGVFQSTCGRIACFRGVVIKYLLNQSLFHSLFLFISFFISFQHNLFLFERDPNCE